MVGFDLVHRIQIRAKDHRLVVGFNAREIIARALSELCDSKANKIPLVSPEENHNSKENQATAAEQKDASDSSYNRTDNHSNVVT